VGSAGNVISKEAPRRKPRIPDVQCDTTAGIQIGGRSGRNSRRNILECWETLRLDQQAKPPPEMFCKLTNQAAEASSGSVLTSPAIPERKRVHLRLPV